MWLWKAACKHQIALKGTGMTQDCAVKPEKVWEDRLKRIPVPLKLRERIAAALRRERQTEARGGERVTEE